MDFNPSPDPVDFAEPTQEQLALLIDLSRKINSRMDLDTILRKVVEYSISLTRAERGFLFLSEGHEHLRVKIALDSVGRSILEAPIRVSSGVVSAMLSGGIPIFLENVRLNPSYSGRASLLEAGVQFVMGIPLRAKGRILGFIYVDNTRSSRCFSSTDRQILTSFSDQAALALENARLTRAFDDVSHEAAIGRMAEHLASVLGECCSRIASLREAIGSMRCEHPGDVKVDREMVALEARAAAALREFEDWREYSGQEFTIDLGRNEIDDIVAAVVQRVVPILESGGVRIHVSLNIGRPSMLDARRLGTAIDYILRNTIETIANRPGAEIALTTAPVPEGLLVEIRDNGPGVGPQDVEKYFDAFRSGTCRAGCGVGLAIAQLIVERHRGRIEVKSTPEAGTQIWIVLPLDLRPSMFPRKLRISQPPPA